MLSLKNYIQGQFQEPSDQVYSTKYSPWDGNSIYQYPQSNAMDAVLAVQSARKSQAAWAELEFSERVEWLKKIYDFLQTQSHAIVEAESLSQGMNQEIILQESFSSGLTYLSQYTQLHKTDINTHRSAIGVISIVLPWTLSFRYLMQKLAPALYYGNTVVIKSSHQSAISADFLAQAAQNIGLPPGVLNVIHGRGQDVGSILTSHPAVAAVSLSGSLQTCEKVILSSSQQFKKLQLFSGVKNSAIVLSDFDFNSMPQLVRSCFEGNGQLAFNISRIFVPDSIYESFCIKLREEVLKLPELPLISEEKFLKAQEYLKMAVSEGAKILVGHDSNASTGHYFFKPTVLLNLPNCSELQQLDLQAPIVILTSVKYQHEAVKWVNTGYSGLMTQVWSESIEKAQKLLLKLEQSIVLHNQWMEALNPLKRIKGTRQSFYGIFADEDFNSELKVLSVKKTD